MGIGGPAGTVLQDPGLRRIALAFSGFSITEHSTWLAIMVYAYQQGGIEETGIAAVVQLVPAALLAPVLGVAGDRFRRDRVLTAGFAFLVVALAGTALLMHSDLGRWSVYAAATLVSITLTVGRPTVSAILPSIADTPDELTAANVSIGFVETLGLFVGPALAGLILASWSPMAVFAIAAVIMVAATLATLHIPMTDLGASHLDEEESPLNFRAFAAGATLLRRERNPQLLVFLLAATLMIDGALDVGFAAISVEVLGNSEAGAGLLAAAFGLGAMAGVIGSVSLVGRRRLSLPLSFGIVATSLPLTLVGFSSSTAVAYVLLALTGAGAALVDVAGRTMLQGLAPEDTLARIFGLLEGLSMAGLAIGGAAFAVLAVALGVELALVVLGFGLLALLAFAWRRLHRIDVDRVEVDPELLSLLRANPLFSPLPAFTIEQLLHRLEPVSFEPAQLVMRQGDPGDLYHLIASGEAEVIIDGRLETTFGRGEAVGEIALLRDVPRTATVKAGPDGLTTYALDRVSFLEAVTGYPRSWSRANVQADQRLQR